MYVYVQYIERALWFSGISEFPWDRIYVLLLCVEKVIQDTSNKWMDGWMDGIHNVHSNSKEMIIVLVIFIAQGPNIDCP